MFGDLLGGWFGADTPTNDDTASDNLQNMSGNSATFKVIGLKASPLIWLALLALGGFLVWKFK